MFPKAFWSAANVVRPAGGTHAAASVVPPSDTLLPQPAIVSRTRMEANCSRAWCTKGTSSLRRQAHQRAVAAMRIVVVDPVEARVVHRDPSRELARRWLSGRPSSQRHALQTDAAAAPVDVRAVDSQRDDGS